MYYVFDILCVSCATLTVGPFEDSARLLLLLLLLPGWDAEAASDPAELTMPALALLAAVALVGAGPPEGIFVLARPLLPTTLSTERR